jgi:hypothetical protein
LGSEQLVKDRSHRVNVTALVYRSAEELFRGHVLGLTDQRAGVIAVSCSKIRHAEVSDLDAISLYQHVRWLQIAMNQ